MGRWAGILAYRNRIFAVSLALLLILSTVAASSNYASGVAGNVRVEYDGGVWFVNYSLTNGEIDRAFVDEFANSIVLIISINSREDGTLAIELPRDLIDAKTPAGQDDIFFVLRDGDETSYSETITTSTARTLSFISIPPWTEEIEIIGTQVGIGLPEPPVGDLSWRGAPKVLDFAGNEARAITAGDEIHIVDEIINSGMTPDPTFRVSHELIDTQGNVLGTGYKHRNTVAAGDTLPYPIGISTGRIGAGDFALIITIDTLDEIRESDEGNNDLVVPFTVLPAAGGGGGGATTPDIIEIPQSKYRPDDTIDFLIESVRSNTDPRVVDLVSVRVSSSIDSKMFTLPESSVNTGIFPGSIRLGQDLQVASMDRLTFTFGAVRETVLIEGIPSPQKVDLRWAGTLTLRDAETQNQMRAPQAAKPFFIEHDVAFDGAPGTTAVIDIRVSVIDSRVNLLIDLPMRSQKLEAGRPFTLDAGLSITRPGTYNIVLQLDSLDQFGEDDETNNAVRYVLTVRDRPGVIIPEIEFDKGGYTSTDTMIVTVVSAGSNTDPSAVEMVNLQVAGVSDLGEWVHDLSVELRETDRNTGVFIGKVSLTRSSSTAPNELQVSESGIVMALFAASPDIVAWESVPILRSITPPPPPPPPPPPGHTLPASPYWPPDPGTVLTDKTEYSAGESVLVMGSFDPRSSVSVLVFDPNGDLYIEEKLQTGSDGTFSFSFALQSDAIPGEWGAEVVAAGDIEELNFRVLEAPAAQGTAVIKNLKKLTLIAITNESSELIPSFKIKVDLGSIRFVKAKEWDRQRISTDEVELISTTSRGLKQDDHLVVLMLWDDRADFTGKVRMPLNDMVMAPIHVITAPPRTEHSNQISLTWPLDHVVTESGKWPANHNGDNSVTWPQPHLEHKSRYWPSDHKGSSSVLWPVNHDGEYSVTWPPGHTQSRSITWPADHFGDVSRGWPSDHTQSVSLTWPPDHTSESSLTWPSPHREATSDKWPANHQGSSSVIWPPDHNTPDSESWGEEHVETISREWPANHDGHFSDSWPENHHFSVSIKWPPDHNFEYSKDWPTDHYHLLSITWPPDHEGEISVEWPPGHEKAESKVWPPEHTQAKSVTWPRTHDPSESSDWPPNHNGHASLTWPVDHSSFVSTEWPPDHFGHSSKTWKDHRSSISESWPPNHSGTSSATWDSNHESGMSQSWPADHDGHESKTWGEEHISEISETWPAGHNADYSLSWPEDHEESLSREWPANHHGETSRGGMSTTGESSSSSSSSYSLSTYPTAQPREKDFSHTDSIKLDVQGTLNLDHVEYTFAQVFNTLENEVTVYPTENYFYYRFEVSNDDGGDGGGEIWGNIRLSPPERDDGFIHFAYFEFNENPLGPDDFDTRYKKLGTHDDVKVKKVNDLRYVVAHNGKRVIFNLNSVEQEPPSSFQLRPAEIWLQNTHDESGLNFHLTYNTNTNSFIWVLNEEEYNPEEWIMLSDRIMLGKRTKFVFYIDKEEEQQDRKILIGVEILNIKQNNYYDGPFDQLADNFITKESSLSAYIQEAYPYTNGYVDDYGKFKHRETSRVAITPYYAYPSTEALVEMVDWCTENRQGDDFFGCIAYDHKSRY